MCRSIKTLRAPSARDGDAFDAAVDEVAAATDRLLDRLVIAGRS